MSNAALVGPIDFPANLPKLLYTFRLHSNVLGLVLDTLDWIFALDKSLGELPVCNAPGTRIFIRTISLLYVNSPPWRTLACAIASCAVLRLAIPTAQRFANALHRDVLSLVHSGICPPQPVLNCDWSSFFFLCCQLVAMSSPSSVTSVVFSGCHLPRLRTLSPLVPTLPTPTRLQNQLWKRVNWVFLHLH